MLVTFIRVSADHSTTSNMASPGEGGGKDDVKTQFVTREGVYKLMTLSEYSRPNKTAYNGQGNPPVKTSFITLEDQTGTGEGICFNIGRELYFYHYKGVRKAADLTKPIDKRVYKGTFPTCHDFNTFTARDDFVMLLIGFTAGQIQLVDPIKKELSKLYNEDRLIDKSKVTCIKWIPGSPNQFIVSYSSGQLYVYNEELHCGATPPHYQMFKHGDAYSVHTCKTKSTRNPLYRWIVGEGAINEFAFSPCSKHLAVVSQDGYLRVFDFDSMNLVGSMRSYFGGLLCVCWSPDGKYIVTGGEDDLVTVWSFYEKRVVCRGNGHKSWVNMVAFDPYTTSLSDIDGLDFSGSDEDFTHPAKANHNLLQETLRASTRSNNSRGSKCSTDSKMGSMVTYRFGSIGQDTQLCLWDITEDILRQQLGRQRTSTVISNPAALGIGTSTLVATKSNSAPHQNSILNSFSKDTSVLVDGTMAHNSKSHQTTVSTSFTHKFATLALGERSNKDKDHKRNFSLGSKSGDHVKTNHVKTVVDESLKMLGTSTCPRLPEVPMLEALVCKKVAHERLTSLVFKEETIVTACQEGYVCTWARPGKVNLTQQQQHSVSSPTPQKHSPHGSTAL